MKSEHQREMMRAFRCRVCGEVYLGAAAPANCPFCGVPRKFLVTFEEWTPLAEHPLCMETLKDLEHALELEISNARFYRDAFERVSDPYRHVFKALSHIESEHATVIRKLLNLSPGDMPSIHEVAFDTLEQNLEESELREKRAIDFYKQLSTNAAERGIRLLFGALVTVELDHLGSSHEKLRKSED